MRIEFKGHGNIHPISRPSNQIQNVDQTVKHTESERLSLSSSDFHRILYFKWLAFQLQWSEIWLSFWRWFRW